VDVVVIGAGIVGASLAYHLAALGARVTVLDRERPAAGTTQTSFAWVNAHNKPPRPYHELNAAGVAEHHRLAAELGGGWFHATGCLQIADEPAAREALRTQVARLREWGYAAEPIDAERVRGLEPDLALPADADFALFPDEGWVEAPVLTHALLARAEQAGATLVYPATALAPVLEGSRMIGVQSTAGSFSADVVVECTGREAGAMLAPLGLRVERRRSPGLLVATGPMPTCLSSVVLWPQLNIRPDGAGRVLVQGADVDDALPLDEGQQPDPQTCRLLLERAAVRVPALRGARVEATRLGWRAMPGDGFSAVGPVPGALGCYLVFTHSGVTLGPLLGRLAAQEILLGRRDPLLAGFRPDRLVTSA
jgi:glycine/D-amino acid oxidase-like deaminating enzyme